MSPPDTLETCQQLVLIPLNAIASANDHIALGGLRALEAGRGVPDHVAVTGFCDCEIGRFAEPPLTSVCFDIAMMGIIAARRLCLLLEARDAQAWLTLLPTSLTVRVSSGPASAGGC